MRERSGSVPATWQAPPLLEAIPMSLRPDLVGGPVGPIQPSQIVEAERRFLAMLCGFLDGSNKPCQWLGLRPVMMNGEALGLPPCLDALLQFRVPREHTSTHHYQS